MHAMLFWNFHFAACGFEQLGPLMTFKVLIVLKIRENISPPAVFSIKAESSLRGAHLSEEGPAMATDHIVIIDRFMCSGDS